MQRLLTAGLFAAAACVVYGQTAATPLSFEVASIKAAAPPTDGRLMVRMGGDPGRINWTNVSLMNARNMLWVLSDDITVYFERLGLLKRLPLETLRTAAPLSTLRVRGRSLSPAAARLVGCLQIAAREIAVG